ncbi:MAG: hypothetical protein Q9164_004478 [Protoblastenia rupestris]
MGFFKSLRGNHPDTIGGPSSQGTMQNISSNKEDNNAHSTEAPCHPSPDPPPSQHSQYQAPQGPPPRNSGYAPPPGPPPSHQNYEHTSTPTTSSQEPPPYHDWTIIPDTALLPPPPSVGYETGIASNADPCEADRARDWCRVNPLIFPHQPTSAQIATVRNGNVQLMRPKEYRGELFTPRTGVWQGITRAGSSDSCILTSSPLYFAHADSPTRTGQPKTIYFELEVTSLGYGSKTDVCSIAIGYCALPYPTWRMPGWERASLAVHSDDGHRFVNDNLGGRPFTTPFRVDDTVGIGMSFSLPENPPEYHIESGTPLLNNKVEVFFTKNGKKEGGWNLHEELDNERDQGVDGLDGLFDLFGAIGVFGGAEFRVKCKRDEWLWRPR